MWRSCLIWLSPIVCITQGESCVDILREVPIDGKQCTEIKKLLLNFLMEIISAAKEGVVVFF